MDSWHPGKRGSPQEPPTTRLRERSPDTGENKISYFQKLTATGHGPNPRPRLNGTIAKFIGSTLQKRHGPGYFGARLGKAPADGKIAVGS